jgi:predicted nucleic acid-binding protein
VVIVDTSVWIAANRRPDGEEAVALRSLLDADDVALALPVRVELMAGVAAKDRSAFRRGLSALPVSYPTDETWALIEQWVPRAADAGQHFKVADLLIAALAAELTGLVWSLDKDFERMEQLGFAHLYGPS